MNKLLRFVRLIIPFWKKEAIVLSLGFLSMMLGLANPYLTKLIIDKAYPAGDLKLFIALAAIIGFIFILNNLFKGLSDYLNSYVKLRLSLDLSRRVFKKIYSLPYKYFQNSSTGEHIYKISYDVEQATQFIVNLLPQIIILIPKSIFIFAVIFYIRPKMALFCLALTPFLYIGPYFFTKMLKKAWKAWVESSQDIFKRLQETLSHMYLIKSFGKEKQETRSYMKDVINNARLKIRSVVKLEVTASFMNSVIQKAILGVILFYGGYQVIKGNMTLGSLSAISIYLSQLSGIQAIFAGFAQQVSSGLVSCDRLDKILNREVEAIQDARSERINFSKGIIEFKGSSFSYNQDKKILDNLSFSIEGGSRIALAGPSGCGKTTIINLILKLYKLSDGEILIDGVDINNIESKSFYSQIGVALQEPYLWNDTIENNIRYGKMDATLGEIKESAAIACIGDVIDNIPKKYNAIIGENACKISEGQKQRIAIARAIVKRPKILILDEALSSLDAETENKIIDNIKGFLSASTIIIVSHRPFAIKKMDLVYFLGSPDKMAIAGHENLLKNNIRYSECLKIPGP